MLDSIRNVTSSVEQQNPRILVTAGPPGTGKTRILQSLWDYTFKKVDDKDDLKTLMKNSIRVGISLENGTSIEITEDYNYECSIAIRMLYSYFIDSNYYLHIPIADTNLSKEYEFAVERNRIFLKFLKSMESLNTNLDELTIITAMKCIDIYNNPSNTQKRIFYLTIDEIQRVNDVFILKLIFFNNLVKIWN